MTGQAEQSMFYHETLSADIPSMSDANGWNLPQHYLTIQAADIDGKPGAELIGRSVTNVQTWRFARTTLQAKQVVGAAGFPPFTGLQQQYYQYVSTKLGNGVDIRANYDQLSSDLIVGLKSTLENLSPPTGVLPTDPNWQAVQNRS